MTIATTGDGSDGELDPEDIEESDDLLPLPTSAEIDEWSMMEEFAQQLPKPLSEELLAASLARGRFRHVPHHRQEPGLKTSGSLPGEGVCVDAPGSGGPTRYPL